jgi:uncharacterized membrane protein
MTENESTGMLDMESKFWRTTLLLVSVVLIFAGPTYVPYVMSDIAHIDYIASTVVGVVLLIVGLVLMWFLVRKKVIT